MIKNILVLVFYPQEGYYRIKRSSKLWEALVLILLAVIVRLVSIYWNHYPLNPVDPRFTNLLLEVLTVIVPIISWTIAAYMITSITDGEAGLLDYMKCTAYALIPYIVLTIPLAGISRMLSLSNIGFFGFAQGLIFLWVGILLYLQLMALNSYTPSQTVKSVLLTIFGIACIWVVCVIIYVFTANIIIFARLVIQEIQLIFYT